MILNGKCLNKGLAIGTALFYSTDQPAFAAAAPALEISDIPSEQARFGRACDRVRDRLQSLIGQNASDDRQACDILNSHIVMLDDPEFIGFVSAAIQEEKLSAEAAVAKAGRHFTDLFSSLPDELLASRAEDVKDICSQLLSALCGENPSSADTEQSCIIIARELTPSQIISLKALHPLGLALASCPETSHTAILARSMGIPVLSDLDLTCLKAFDSAQPFARQTAICDGQDGVLLLNPDSDQLKRYEELLTRQEKEAASLEELRRLPNATRSGRTVDLFANVNDLSELPLARQNDAGGIGLFRSEFLYLNAKNCPSEEEQFQIYHEILKALPGKPVTIRTIDIGADKKAPCLKLQEEENPALGLRGSRLCLQKPELFKTQLRALYRAALYEEAANCGRLSILFPMISSLWEIQRIKEILAEVRTGLCLSHPDYCVPEAFDRVRLGIMIETPAAALMSDELAREVDFLSIGTNDLTQYTLAADRQNDLIKDFYDPHHPALLRLIKTVVENGHREGCRVAICGELAGDLAMTETFLDMGIDEFSVSPALILPLRRQIRSLP